MTLKHRRHHSPLLHKFQSGPLHGMLHITCPKIQGLHHQPRKASQARRSHKVLDKATPEQGICLCRFPMELSSWETKRVWMPRVKISRPSVETRLISNIGQRDSKTIWRRYICTGVPRFVGSAPPKKTWDTKDLGTNPLDHTTNQLWSWPTNLSRHWSTTCRKRCTRAENSYVEEEWKLTTGLRCGVGCVKTTEAQERLCSLPALRLFANIQNAKSIRTLSSTSRGGRT